MIEENPRSIFKRLFWVSIFVVCLIIIIARLFIIHPYRIPSSSMLPTLQAGDFILVNKTSYGVQLPFTDFKFSDTNLPQKGDVAVFKFPRNPKLAFIKRVVGTPGDKLSYKNKQLFVNGELAAMTENGKYLANDARLHDLPLTHFTESIQGSEYSIILDNSVIAKDMEVVVPEGHYFVLGDNRDHSNDSRYWRFVPEENLIGKAFYIWFSRVGGENSVIDWGRIGQSIN